MKTIHVAAAVIRDGDRIFATQRGYGPYKDGWEFPGGKIEAGETPEQASRLIQVEYDYPEFHLSMGCYWCTVLSGRLTLKEHEAAKWLRPEELDTVRWLPADREIIRLLKQPQQTKGQGPQR